MFPLSTVKVFATFTTVQIAQQADCRFVPDKTPTKTIQTLTLKL